MKRKAELVVSFWHIGLENIPEGQFRHRSLPPKDARRLIDHARKARALKGASHDDLFAPYHKHEKENHAKLCQVLREHYGIGLTLKDFVVQFKDGGRPSYSIFPLQLAQVSRSSRILVVSCNYTMSQRRKRDRLDFDIAPDSVTFHLFESIASKKRRSSAS